MRLQLHNSTFFSKYSDHPQHDKHILTTFQLFSRNILSEVQLKYKFRKYNDWRITWKSALRLCGEKKNEHIHSDSCEFHLNASLWHEKRYLTSRNLCIYITQWLYYFPDCHTCHSTTLIVRSAFKWCAYVGAAGGIYPFFRTPNKDGNRQKQKVVDRSTYTKKKKRQCSVCVCVCLFSVILAAFVHSRWKRPINRGCWTNEFRYSLRHYALFILAFLEVPSPFHKENPKVRRKP